MEDFLSLEPLLIERLKAQVEGFNGHVFGAPELGGFAAKKRTPPTPSCDVVFAGLRPLEDRGDGVTRIEQTWYVVPRVRNLREVTRGEAARADGGPLVAATLAALLGWKPSPEHKALRLGNAPAPEYQVGTLEVPLAFITEVVIKPV